MEVFRRTLAFIVGLALVLYGILGHCPRIGAVVVGLMLMGVFTVPEAIAIFRGKENDKTPEEE